MCALLVVYHVVPNASATEWVISRDDDRSFCELYRTKEEAIEAAAGRARRHRPSQLRVHRTYRDIDYEELYP